MIILFKNQTVADTWKKEICVTPDEVWLYLGPIVKPSTDVILETLGDPDGTPNVVTSPVGEDGRVLMEHGFSEDDVKFLQEYCADAIASGDIQLLDKVPTDWVGKGEM